MKLHKKMIKMLSLLGVATSIFTLTNFGATANAAKQAKPASNQPSFIASAVLSKDNQGKKPYFNLKMKPNETRTIKVRVKNLDKQSEKFVITPNNATTNSNGIVDYTKHNVKSKYLKLGLTDVIHSNKSQVVTVPGKSTKDFSYKLTMPNTKFKGIILGGFTIAPNDAVKKAMAQNKKQKNPQAIASTFQYVIAVRLFQKSEAVMPNVKFHGADYVVKNQFATVNVNMSNSAPDLAKFKSGYSEVRDSKGKLIIHNKLSNLSFAPNSEFGYYVNLNTKQLAAGKYTVKLHFDGVQTYNYSTNFTVTPQKVKHVKNAAADFTPKPKQETNYLWAFVIGGIALLVIIALILYIRHMKKATKQLTDDSKSGSDK